MAFRRHKPVKALGTFRAEDFGLKLGESADTHFLVRPVGSLELYLAIGHESMLLMCFDQLAILPDGLVNLETDHEYVLPARTLAYEQGVIVKLPAGLKNTIYKDCGPCEPLHIHRARPLESADGDFMLFVRLVHFETSSVNG